MLDVGVPVAVAGILLIAPLIGVGVGVIVDAMLGLAGVGALSYAFELSGVTVTISAGVVAGAISVLSAIAVSGASIYGEEWLQVDGPLELAFKPGGLGVGAVAGAAIVVAIVWETLWEALDAGSTIAIVASALGVLAIAWIASRSVTSFRAGRRSPE